MYYSGGPKPAGESDCGSGGGGGGSKDFPSTNLAMLSKGQVYPPGAANQGAPHPPTAVVDTETDTGDAKLNGPPRGRSDTYEESMNMRRGRDSAAGAPCQSTRPVSGDAIDVLDSLDTFLGTQDASSPTPEDVVNAGRPRLQSGDDDEGDGEGGWLQRSTLNGTPTEWMTVTTASHLNPYADDESQVVDDVTPMVVDTQQCPLARTQASDGRDSHLSLSSVILDRQMDEVLAARSLLAPETSNLLAQAASSYITARRKDNEGKERPHSNTSIGHAEVRLRQHDGKGSGMRVMSAMRTNPLYQSVIDGDDGTSVEDQLLAEQMVRHHRTRLGRLGRSTAPSCWIALTYGWPCAAHR